MADPIPAATLIIFRESAGAALELLFVERAATMAFAGGALVFPGGRIDPGDHVLAATLTGDTGDLAARIAAIRETVEEVALPIGLTPPPDRDALAALRAALHGGVAIGAALGDAGLAIDPAALTGFARWCPAHEHRRNFDTRFYLARLPAGAADPVVDATENVRVFWASAARVLADADAGHARIIFPTRRTLERLARFADFAAAADDAARRPERTITPWIEDRGGVPHLCIPDDLGYPVTCEAVSSAMRG